MTAFAAWRAGLGRVRRAPTLLLLLWLGTIAMTIPPGLAMQAAIQAHLGSSLEADGAADGVNTDWLHEFRAASGSFGRTLRADLVGFGAVLDNASSFADLEPRPMIVVLASAAWIVLVWFLSPGLIYRLAADRPIGPEGVLGTCGAFLVRMGRLAIVSAFVQATLVVGVHQWLFDGLFESATRDLTVERTAAVIRLACYIAFVAVIAIFNLLFDLARVRMVIEDRRSVVASVIAAGEFMRLRPGLAAGLYALDVATFGVVVGAYALFAPGAGSAGIGMWGGFVVSQAYIAARLAVKLAFWASEAAAVQAVLASPGFVRPAVPAD